MLPFLLAATIPASVLALLVARWEYRRRGRLTWFGLSALCALMLFPPNLVLDFATDYAWPSTALDWVGVVLGFAGLALCAVSILFFGFFFLP